MTEPETVPGQGRLASEDEPVLADEGQLLNVLMQLHVGGKP